MGQIEPRESYTPPALDDIFSQKIAVSSTPDADRPESIIEELKIEIGEAEIIKYQTSPINSEICEISSTQCEQLSAEIKRLNKELFKIQRESELNIEYFAQLCEDLKSTGIEEIDFLEDQISLIQL